MVTPKKTTEYRTVEFREWVAKNFAKEAYMREYEADMFAKCIRNRTEIPLPMKKALVDDICKAFMNKNQFFNQIRFRDISLQALPDRWPRDK